MLYHQTAHSLLLDPLVFLLLLPLGVGVVGGHRLGQLLDFARDGAMVFLEIFSVLENAIEVFLWRGKERQNRQRQDRHASRITGWFGVGRDL